jgi:GNAT superfamily N-acetyltransferase
MSRVKQYGPQASLLQLLRWCIRRLIRIEENIVFTIADFAGYNHNDTSIKGLSSTQIDQFSKSGQITALEIRQLHDFVSDGCCGFYAEVGGRIAGYAWVQFNGIYRFGKSGHMRIPPGYAVAKNLFIFPDFRGKRISQRLNKGRLATIPSGNVPTVFINPENRYAIRNWEKFGFRRILSIRRWKWAGRPWRMSITVLKDCKQAQELKQALLEEHEDA